MTHIEQGAPGNNWMQPHHRQQFVSGFYGRIIFDFAKSGNAHVDIQNPHQGMSANELREAAHFFNQLAEQLEDKRASTKPKEPEIYMQAVRLLKAIFEKHFENAPGVEISDTLSGVINQLDHFTSGLVRRPQKEPLNVNVSGARGNAEIQQMVKETVAYELSKQRIRKP